jgi:hypothetical protein
VSNCTTHVSWTEHAGCQWNGQAHVLSVMNAKARVAQRRHARFCPLAYDAHSMPHGSIGSPPERGAGVYADRYGSHQTRSDTFPWGSRLTVDALEYITFSGHVAAPELPTWWGQVLLLARVVARGWGESWPGPTYSSFTTRLKIATWVLRLHTAVRGTLVSGYRQWPPGSPQGRM